MTAQRFRIVCFGDSLTVGLRSPTPDDPQGGESPYGAMLQAMLGAGDEVLTRGINGDVTSNMLTRFARDATDSRPTHVVILAGTNDLGTDVPTQEVFANLVQFYDATIAAGAVPVAVTIPSFRFELAPDDWAVHLERRAVVNGLIAAHCASRAILCADLFTATADPSDGQLALAFSNDGLHMTAAGYRRFAELVHGLLHLTKG
jgi:acyl-CoA thioesterase I